MQAGQCIAEIIKECEQIEELDLSNNPFKEYGTSLIIYQISEKTAQQNLKCINLDSVDCSIVQVSDQALSRFGRTLRFQTIENQKLTKFIFDNNQFMEPIINPKDMSSDEPDETEQKLNSIPPKDEQEETANKSEDAEEKKKNEKKRKKKTCQITDKTYIEKSVLKIVNLILTRINLQQLSLNNCKLGDIGFQTLIARLGVCPNPQNLSLNVKNNMITNKSIQFINVNILKQIPINMSNNWKGNVFYDKNKCLRLKSLNLSRNNITVVDRPSSQADEDQNTNLDPRIYTQKQIQKQKLGNLMSQLELCPLRRFFAKFQSQVFLQSIDLSHNDQITNNFCAFLCQLYENFKVESMKLFKIYIREGQSIGIPAKQNAFDERQLNDDSEDQEQNNRNGASLFSEAYDLARMRIRHEENMYKFQNNLVTTNIHLSGCGINIQQLETLNNILQKNKDFRDSQQDLLDKQEQEMLRQQQNQYSRVLHKLAVANDQLKNEKEAYIKTQGIHKKRKKVHTFKSNLVTSELESMQEKAEKLADKAEELDHKIYLIEKEQDKEMDFQQKYMHTWSKEIQVTQCKIDETKIKIKDELVYQDAATYKDKNMLQNIREKIRNIIEGNQRLEEKIKEIKLNQMREKYKGQKRQGIILQQFKDQLQAFTQEQIAWATSPLKLREQVGLSSNKKLRNASLGQLETPSQKIKKETTKLPKFNKKSPTKSNQSISQLGKPQLKSESPRGEQYEQWKNTVKSSSLSESSSPIDEVKISKEVKDKSIQSKQRKRNRAKVIDNRQELGFNQIQENKNQSLSPSGKVKDSQQSISKVKSQKIKLKTVTNSPNIKKDAKIKSKIKASMTQKSIIQIHNQQTERISNSPKKQKFINMKQMNKLKLQGGLLTQRNNSTSQILNSKNINKAEMISIKQKDDIEKQTKEGTSRNTPHYAHVLPSAQQVTYSSLDNDSKATNNSQQNLITNMTNDRSRTNIMRNSQSEKFYKAYNLEDRNQQLQSSLQTPNSESLYPDHFLFKNKQLQSLQLYQKRESKQSMQIPLKSNHRFMVPQKQPKKRMGKDIGGQAEEMELNILHYRKNAFHRKSQSQFNSQFK